MTGLSAGGAGNDYVFWEVWSLLIIELQNNLTLSLICIFICCNGLLLHPGSAVLISLLGANPKR